MAAVHILCRALQEAESRLEGTLERCQADESALGSLRSRLEAVTGVLQVRGLRVLGTEAAECSGSAILIYLQLCEACYTSLGFRALKGNPTLQAM